MVNTEPMFDCEQGQLNYNILNIVVNTEPGIDNVTGQINYNILNIVVNTELQDQV